MRPQRDAACRAQLSEGIETGWLEGVAILVAVLIVLNVTAANDMQKDRQFRQLNAINNRKLIKVVRARCCHCHCRRRHRRHSRWPPSIMI